MMNASFITNAFGSDSIGWKFEVLSVGTLEQKEENHYLNL